MTQVVNSNLLFKSLCGCLSFWQSHDTGVVQEDIDFVIFGIECLGKLFDGCKVVKIKRNPFKRSSRYLLLNISDSICSSLFTSACHNDLLWFKFTHLNSRDKPKSCVSTGDNNRLALKIWPVFICSTVEIAFE